MNNIINNAKAKLLKNLVMKSLKSEGELSLKSISFNHSSGGKLSIGGVVIKSKSGVFNIENSKVSAAGEQDLIISIKSLQISHKSISFELEDLVFNSMVDLEEFLIEL